MINLLSWLKKGLRRPERINRRRFELRESSIIAIIGRLMKLVTMTELSSEELKILTITDKSQVCCLAFFNVLIL